MLETGDNPTAAQTHLVIASGGTGGHFFPAQAAAAEFCRRGGRATLLLAGQQLEQQLAGAREQGIPAEALPAVRLPHGVGAAIAFPVRLLAVVRQAHRVLRRLQPDLVLGMGSFAAFPTCAAAVLQRLPLLLHEANARAGRANRILSRRARALATSLPLAPGQRLFCPQVRTGLPVRPDLLAAASSGTTPDAARQALGLDPATPLLLVFGGSQGARQLNELMTQTLPGLGPGQPWQAVHLTGTDDNAALSAAYATAGIPAVVQRSEPHIERCYLAADLVFCRAGASTVTELALFGRPAILAPLPWAADDHQSANAQVLVQAGCAHLFPESGATAAALGPLLRNWLTDPGPWREAARHTADLVRVDAASRLVDLILSICG